MIAVIYLEGDGALVLGTGEQAREVPVKPGRLVVWPNTDFIHSAYGKQRRLVGPLAVVPGDRTAPLWLTVKGVGALKVIVPMAMGMFIFSAVQFFYGNHHQINSSCKSTGMALGIPGLLMLSGAWKFFMIFFFSLPQFASIVQVGIAILGTVINIYTDPSDCNERLYDVASIMIGMDGFLALAMFGEPPSVPRPSPSPHSPVHPF